MSSDKEAQGARSGFSMMIKQGEPNELQQLFHSHQKLLMCLPDTQQGVLVPILASSLHLLPALEQLFHLGVCLCDQFLCKIDFPNPTISFSIQHCSFLCDEYFLSSLDFDPHSGFETLCFHSQQGPMLRPADLWENLLCESRNEQIQAGLLE